MRTTRTTLWRTVPGVAVLAALALTACAPEDDPAEFEETEAAAQTEEQPQEATEDPAEATETEDESDEGEAGAPSEPDAEVSEAADTEVGDPIDTMTVPMADDLGEVTIGLHSLVHKGDAMVLMLSFTPDLEVRDETRVQDMFGLGASSGYGLRPTLHDRENLKRYSVMGVGTGDRGWQSAATADIPDGEPGYHWAHFAAPEDDIDSLSISVVPGAPEFEDVEIQDAGDQ